MLLGTEVHSYIERELKGLEHPENLDPKVKRIAEAGREYWPSRGVEVERPISINDPAPGFIGFIDIFVPDDDVPEIIDHKTVGNWDYALTKERLPFDLQMIIYAKFIDAPTIRLTHLQYATKGKPECRRISCVVNRDHIDREYAKLATVVKEMKPLATAAINSVDVEGDRSSCSAYGGCPYLHICNSIPGENKRPFAGLNKPTTKGKKMSKLADLLEKRRQKDIAKVIPPDLEEERETAPETNEDLPLLAAAKSPAPTGVDYAPVIAHLLNLQPGNLKGVKSALKEVLNMKRLHAKHIDATVEASEGLITREGDAFFYRAPAPDQIVEALPEIVAEPLPEPTDEIDVLPDDPGLWHGSTAPEVEAIPPAPIEISETPELRLFVDCLPVGEHTISLGEFLSPFIDAVAAEHGGLDPLLLDYGKGTRFVAAKVTAVLKTTDLHHDIFVQSTNPYWPTIAVSLTA